MTNSNDTPKSIQFPLPLDDMTVEIPLNNGYLIVVDAVDASLFQSKWGRSHEYAVRGVGYRRKGTFKMLYLHRVIMERVLNRPLLESEFVDHANGNGLDNRRSNLRLATKRDNGRNKKINSNNTSGYRGVSFDKSTGKWAARIKVNGKEIHLGSFETPEIAYQAYVERAKVEFGVFFDDTRGRK